MVKRTWRESSNLLLDRVGKAGWYLNHVDLVRFNAGAHFVLRPQGNKLAAWGGSVGTHGSPGVGVWGVDVWVTNRQKALQDMVQNVAALYGALFTFFVHAS